MTDKDLINLLSSQLSEMTKENNQLKKRIEELEHELDYHFSI